MNKLEECKKQCEYLISKYNLSDTEALKAVEQNGFTLQYIRNQTYKICLAAVEQNGFALQYVRNQTLEICLAAMEQSVLASKYVNPKLFEEEIESLYCEHVCNCPYRKGK